MKLMTAALAYDIKPNKLVYEKADIVEIIEGLTFSAYNELEDLFCCLADTNLLLEDKRIAKDELEREQYELEYHIQASNDEINNLVKKRKMINEEDIHEKINTREAIDQYIAKLDRDVTTMQQTLQDKYNLAVRTTNECEQMIAVDIYKIVNEINSWFSEPLEPVHIQLVNKVKTVIARSLVDVVEDIVFSTSVSKSQAIMELIHVRGLNGDDMSSSAALELCDAYHMIINNHDMSGKLLLDWLIGSDIFSENDQTNLVMAFPNVVRNIKYQHGKH